MSRNLYQQKILYGLSHLNDQKLPSINANQNENKNNEFDELLQKNKMSTHSPINQNQFFHFQKIRQKSEIKESKFYKINRSHEKGVSEHNLKYNQKNALLKNQFGISPVKKSHFEISPDNKLHNSFVEQSSIAHQEQYRQSPQITLKLKKKDVNEKLPPIEFSKLSLKQNGIIKSYAANTHQGLVRNYNEDRVSIVLNIAQPDIHKNLKSWPNCSFFSIYDGHGGSECADYLKNTLHKYIIEQKDFITDTKNAIYNGIMYAENLFNQSIIKRAINNKIMDRSGSCAVIILIIDDICYVANVGDSRAILVSDLGRQVQSLTMDHKPQSSIEQARIMKYGGQIYQTQIKTPRLPEKPAQIIYGPHRVYPGRLSVSRTLGDVEAKYKKYGGNPKCVIAKPDIKSIKINDNHDFILMGCDGVFDKLNNTDVVRILWMDTKHDSDELNQNQIVGHKVSNLIRECMLRQSLDNITVVMIAFKNISFLKSKYPQQLVINEQEYDDTQDDKNFDDYQLNQISDEQRTPNNKLKPLIQNKINL